jgi:CheY-like chemotaxis protein
MLKNILNDVLDISTIENGKLSLKEETCCLRAGTEKLVDLFGATAAGNHNLIKAKVDPGLCQAFVSDFGKVLQIVSNLLNNAVKFSAFGTVMTLEVSSGTFESLRTEHTEPLLLDDQGRYRIQLCKKEVPLDLPTEEDTQVITFKVTNTGTGMPMEESPRLFHPFEQLDNSYTRKGGGTGLGLSICKSLVFFLGGCIGFETTPGNNQKTTFFVHVPMSRAQPSCQECHAAAFQTESVLESNAAKRLSPRLMKRSAIGVTTCDTTGGSNGSPASGRVSPSLLDDGEEGGAGGKKRKTERVETKIGKKRGKKAHGLAKPAARYILAVDDNVVNCKLILAMLTRLGHKVDLAYNGQQAVSKVIEARAKGRMYDIIFMDVQMPIMDGLEATAKISALFAEPPPKASAAGPSSRVTQKAQYYLDSGEDEDRSPLGSPRHMKDSPTLSPLAHPGTIARSPSPTMSPVFANRSVRNAGATVSPINLPGSLRANCPPPIIAVTAHAFNDAHTECLNAGMSAVVVKPFMMEEIEALLGAFPPPHWT